MAYTTINDPSAYFQTKLYTGGTAEAKTFDGNSNLKPDWFWSKKRGAVQSHQTADSVRGITNSLRTDTTGAEYTNSETDDLASFDTNGFTFNGTGDTYNGTYQSSDYVAWCWSAGGGTTASNTDGSITSTVSANTTSGFSIVQYTGNGTSGATFGHGLGVVPSHIIIKRTSSAEAWVNWHSTFSALQYLRLYQNTAIESSTNLFNNTLPTSSVISLGTGGFTNTSGETYIAYCFAEIPGYSKFGSYTGNGNADGTFVYTGFKPAFVMIKNSSSTANWIMLDNKRNPFNVVNKVITPNRSNAEFDTTTFDALSNGFKARQSDVGNNASGATYIYMAFAEAPLVGTNNVPCTAR